MLISALILGILGSFHCVGMCGPIAFMLPVDRNNLLKRVSQIAIYHFGRLLSYAITGLVFGVIGRSLYIFGFQQQLSILTGITMILIVVIPQKFFEKKIFFSPIYHFISKVKTRFGSSFKKRTMDTFVTIGFLNGFLPCGLVYMAVLASLAFQNTITSIFYMLLFGIGTIPLMTTTVFIGQFINISGRMKIQKAIPVFIILIGTLFIIRGLGLGIPLLSPKPILEVVNNDFNCF